MGIKPLIYKGILDFISKPKTRSKGGEQMFGFWVKFAIQFRES